MKKITEESYNRTQDISVGEVKKLDSFKDWDDEKVAELVRIIKIFTQIAYQTHKKQGNGNIVALSIDNQCNIAA